MAAVNYKRLLKLFESKGSDAPGLLRESFEAKELRPSDIDLGKLFAECYGWHNYLSCRSGQSLATAVMSNALQEADGAVSTAAFQNVSGQFMYTTVLDAYMAEENIFRTLIPEAPASTLDGEKIPGITEIGDEIGVRKETDPYPIAGVGEDWIFTPTIKDRGMIVPVTWEAIFNDKTGLVSQRAGDVGKWMGLRREKQAVDTVIDEIVNDTTGPWRYNWRGTTIATYGDNSGSHTWDNLAATNGLTDWSQVDAAEQLFNAITDPYTGEPVLIEPRHLIVSKVKEQTARRVISGTEIRVATPGYATTLNPTQTLMTNPYLNKYELKTSRLLGARMAVNTSWFLGDITKYAKCMMAEKMNVLPAPPNNQDEFHRRIVQQYRVNERFAYVVVQPRAMVKSTVA